MCYFQRETTLTRAPQRMRVKLRHYYWRPLSTCGLFRWTPLTRGERIWSRKYLRVLTARVFCVLRCSFTSTSNSGRRQRHLTWSSHPRGTHLLMLQGREINLLFFIASTGDRTRVPLACGLQHFTHRPRHPTKS